MTDKFLPKLFFDKIPDRFDVVMVILKSADGWVMVKHKSRAWEFPGGHREADETYIETAHRECYEEAGAEIENIKYFGYHILRSAKIAIIVTATLKTLNPISGNFETDEVKVFTTLPADISFKDGLYDQILKHLING